MVKKINILIIASIIGLIALSVIQGYLINNTYILKKESFTSKASEIISKINNYTPEIDSINEIWKEKFVTSLDEYYIKFITKKEVMKRLKKVTDSLNTTFIKEYNKALATKKLGYDLKFHKILKSIIVKVEGNNDTLFVNDNNKSFILLGDYFDYNDELEISSSLWENYRKTTVTNNNIEKKVAYDLSLKTANFMNIDDRQRIIFNNMRSLLILSFLIFTFVIGLLYYSIKSSITQKKIADIKTDFVNNITHELKTPLSTLYLATKMLKKDEVLSDKSMVNSTVKTIERQNIRLQKLIDQVLNNSLDYTEITLQKENVITGNYMQTILDDFALSINNQEIKLDISIENSNKSILIDKFYITTALLNILENAVKYRATAITVTSKIDKNKNYIITITDNGIGISEKNQKFLFDKFYRVSTKDIHNVKGLGLGLYYSNQIIKAHKGQIKIKSSKGNGANFIIKIPTK